MKCLEDEIPEESVRYIGMTRTTVHCRMAGHLKDRKAKKQSCPLFRHDTDFHNGELMSYTTSILSSEKKIVRLNCTEAIAIEKHPKNLLLNERNEGRRGGIVRITATRVST